MLIREKNKVVALFFFLTEILLLPIFPTISVPLYPSQGLFVEVYSHSRLWLGILRKQGVRKGEKQHELIQENIYRLCYFGLQKHTYFTLQEYILLVFIITACMCEKGTDVFSPHSWTDFKWASLSLAILSLVWNTSLLPTTDQREVLKTVIKFALSI